MAERRSLTEGLQATATPVDPDVARQFVYGEKADGATNGHKPPSGKDTPATSFSAPNLNRVPISTRMRSDFAAALKRASLERQLSGTEPNTLTDIFEQAIEPWLRSNGYLS
jgi:hypothetical protein